MRAWLLPILLSLGWTGFSTKPILSAEPQTIPLPTAEGHCRAGNPTAISKCAIVDRNHRYLGGYIGGGCLKRGEGRCPPEDGTFGYDYIGKGWFPGRVFLGWCHDRKKQPFPGPYATDGPEVPDIFAAQPIRRRVSEAKAEKHHGEGH